MKIVNRSNDNCNNDNNNTEDNEHVENFASSSSSFSGIEKQALYKAIFILSKTKIFQMIFYGEYWMQLIMRHQ
jgi:hypothetical protein